jgi:hypothetical protein
MGNTVISKIQNYRKTIVSKIQTLNYLDDRPVFEKERLTCNAWALGGVEAERVERECIRDEEIAKQNANFEAMRLLQERGRERRLAVYGEDQEPQFESRMQVFRDQMLEKIESHDDMEDIPPLERVEAEELSGSKIVEIEDDLLQEVFDAQNPVVSQPRITVVEDEESMDESVEDDPEPEVETDLVGTAVVETVLDASITATTSEQNAVKYMTPAEQRKADLNLLQEWSPGPVPLDELEQPLLDTPVLLSPDEEETSAFLGLEKQETVVDLEIKHEATVDLEMVEEIHVDEGITSSGQGSKQGWETETPAHVVVIGEQKPEPQESEVLFVKQNTLVDLE